MNQTSNYKLNLPEGRDAVDIEVLNQNFSTLDQQLKATDTRVTAVNSSLSSSINSTKSTLQKAIEKVDSDRKPVIGTYTGDGAASRTINLGFQPAMVLVAHPWGLYSKRGGMAIPGVDAASSFGSMISVTSKGFTVYFDDGHTETNINTHKYMYAAWRE